MIDLGNYDEIIRFANEQVKNFNLHKKTKKFGGGRFQTVNKYIFIHVKYDGTLGKIEIEKPGGTRFFLNP